MPDKRCPNCGLWNSQAATLCDCGFDFDTGAVRVADSSPQPPAATSLIKTAVYGALGALIAIFPISIVKTYFFWIGICGDLPPYNHEFPIALSLCGVTLYSLHTIPFWTYLLSTLVGAALLSVLMEFIFMRVTMARSSKPIVIKSSRVFWPAFFIGVLFVVIFVFILLYLGQ